MLSAQQREAEGGHRAASSVVDGHRVGQAVRGGSRAGEDVHVTVELLQVGHAFPHHQHEPLPGGGTKLLDTDRDETV